MQGAGASVWLVIATATVTLAAAWGSHIVQHILRRRDEKNKVRRMALEEAYAAALQVYGWAINNCENYIDPDKFPEPGPNPLSRIFIVVALNFPNLDDEVEKLNDSLNTFLAWTHSQKRGAFDNKQLVKQAEKLSIAVTDFTIALTKEARNSKN